jgi:hypothetical protein
LGAHNDFGGTMVGLQDGECSRQRPGGDPCRTAPGIGSSLSLIGCDAGEPWACEFVGLTDRGPNQDCQDLEDKYGVSLATHSARAGKGFPVPRFAPTITHLRAACGGRLELTRAIYLRDARGVPLTGVGNTDLDDPPYDYNCQAPLQLDAGGVDPEGIQPIVAPNGRLYYVLVEEYAPSLLVADETGQVLACCRMASHGHHAATADAMLQVLMRYSPASKPLPSAPCIA